MPAHDPHINGSLFQRIKDYILAEIHLGHWREGDVIPTEQALSKQFVVSRMTVNRALRELTSEQILMRIQGSGTFVAQQKYKATLIKVKNIAEEIKDRAHTHRSELLCLERCKANEQQAKQFQVNHNHMLFHSTIVHFENDIPIQIEDRWVNSEVAPEYIQQNFHAITPNEYLMKAAPLQGADYSIEACNAPTEIAELLAMTSKDPCLVLNRTTKSMGRIASVATMWHPGHRYQFTGQF
ncbi:histidine utilization repressor [Solimicrobium silvestre]|uniref:Histidine utilization repressor n=1 Tax=Solimicrobium silvestre TaxID=2099400 RepID=A0A2S9GU10_9BURK|nr:histidine utilization repressor [Solimicrobium silvestre]PRC91225.1 Histidine utilization repressor [Solimicrobium silvestre]